uniref:Uncharacterized protein n=1 Tax=Kwoniella bestiolae CBS 10118 TaxID=1296100 RepID=A0A1B9GAX4_9TREE|nr:hypothetical protein I302_03022 [Kwoniella bestiolae CBS 10118]OCF28171.1 hypothetical protein I302_03022 [Kwoniella bestiolae CBS 10118]
MPRKSYEQHLAEKAAARRRGSVVESETDAESLFSTTTYQSQPSLSSSSPRLSPHLHQNQRYPNQYSYPHPSITRTISSTSYSSSISSPYQRDRGRSSSPLSNSHQELPNVSFNSFPPPSADTSDNEHPKQAQPPTSSSTHLAVPTSSREIARQKRRDQRKYSNSTLLSSKFDSPLRTSIRYLTRKGMGDNILTIGLIFYVIIKWCVVGLIEQKRIYISGEGINWTKVGEEAMWGVVVYEWVRREGTKGGRSTRSQVIALLTVLLSPLSLLSGNTTVPMSMTLRPLTLLSSTEDHTSLFYLFLSLTINQFHSIWGVGVALYVVGRGIWIGGYEGSKYLGLSLLTGTAALSSRYVVCESDLALWISNSYLISSKKLPIPAILHARIAPWIPSIQNLAKEYCKANVPTITISSLVQTILTQKVQTALSILSMIPPITIVLYSNISLRPGDLSRPSPTISLLPLILFLISMPIYLFSSDTQNVNLPLMPMTLLMSFRGSAARGSEGSGVGGEDEVWRVGVGLNALSIISLVSTEASLTTGLIFTVMTILWITLIGASPLISLVVVMIIPSNILEQYIHPTESILLKGVFAAGWFWGMKKLIEGAWALGGLSGGGNKRGKERGRGKSKLV